MLSTQKNNGKTQNSPSRSPRIKDVEPIFGTKTKAQEILLLLSKAKPVVRQGFYEHELPKVQRFCAKNKLFCVLSEFKVILAEKNSVYSNKGVRIPKTMKKGLFFVYMSSEEVLAYEAAYAELVQDHMKLGRILGYPMCCIAAFTNSFSATNTNLEQMPTNPWTNLSKRTDDAVLLSHFPCHSGCPQSINLAKQYYSILERVDNGHAKNILEQLQP